MLIWHIFLKTTPLNTVLWEIYGIYAGYICQNIGIEGRDFTYIYIIWGADMDNIWYFMPEIRLQNVLVLKYAYYYGSESILRLLFEQNMHKITYFMTRFTCNSFKNFKGLIF